MLDEAALGFGVSESAGREQLMAVAVGDQAPDFVLMDGNRQEHRLSDYRGRPVVLAWYVLAFTGG